MEARKGKHGQEKEEDPGSSVPFSHVPPHERVEETGRTRSEPGPKVGPREGKVQHGGVRGVRAVRVFLERKGRSTGPASIGES